MRCEWKKGYMNNWETSCNDSWLMIIGTPFENRMKFCPYCGRKIEEVK